MPTAKALLIAESIEELKARMDQQTKAVQRSKLQVLWWLKTGKATTVKQVVQWSGYHRSTVSRWLKQYRDGGLDALLHEKPRPVSEKQEPGAVKAFKETSGSW